MLPDTVTGGWRRTKAMHQVDKLGICNNMNNEGGTRQQSGQENRWLNTA